MLYSKNELPASKAARGDSSACLDTSCITIEYMSTVTVRLDKKLDSQLNRIAKKTGRPKSELIREALRRQMTTIRFDELRTGVAPFAEARGWLTDEDVFRNIS